MGKFHDRDIKPFFINTLCISPETAPADINNMSGASKEPHQHPLMERWRDHGDIMQMARAFPWVIGDIDIPFQHILPPDPADEMRHGIGHGIDVTGRACHGLG